MAKKQTLHDISRVKFDESEHLSKLCIELFAGTDRACAITGCAMVDSALVGLIRARFVKLSDDEFEAYFHRETAPFQSLSSRTKISHAIGLIGPLIVRHLNTIRGVRNAFAHTVYPLDFNHPTVVDECKRLTDVKIKEIFLKMDDGTTHDLRKDVSKYRERYVLNYLALLKEFERRSDVCTKDKKLSLEFAF